MQIEQAYEAARDHMKYPAFWAADDNACMPHFHSAIELVFVEKGELQTALNGKSVAVKENELLVVPSYTVHTFQTVTSNSIIILQIPLGYISSFNKISRTRRFKPSVLEPEQAIEIGAYMRQMLKEPQTVEKDSFMVRGNVYLVMGRLLERVPMEELPKDSDHPDICNMLAYLNQNYQRPLRLTQLATTFGYSPNRLSHIFNKNVGYGIPEYLNMLRARQVARLIADDSDLSITEAAMQAGFESMRTFYRSFHLNFGMTPLEYAKKLEEKV